MNTELLAVFFITVCSIYRTRHSVYLQRVDEKGSLVILFMVDLLAAFDTIDHVFLLHVCVIYNRIHDQVLVWIRIYLADRLQHVNILKTLNTKFWCSLWVCSRSDPVLPVIH